MTRQVQAVGVVLAYAVAAVLFAYIAVHEAAYGGPVYSSPEVAIVVIGTLAASVAAGLVFDRSSRIDWWTRT